MSYKKLEDILDLVILMQSSREGVSLADIEERYAVSRRTAERMRDLIVYKFPQTEERIGYKNSKKWFIPQGTLRDFSQFSADEMSVLELAVETFEKHNLADKATSLQHIVEKIKAHIAERTRLHIDTDLEVLLETEGMAHRAGPKIQIDTEILGKIRLAILTNKQIKIKYERKHLSKINTFTLNTYGILYGERNHYLLAVHSDGFAEGKVHYFILSNMLFAKEVATEVKRYIFHPNQEMIENEDGTITVKFFAGGKVEMDWHLYTWGNNVKVIQPENWYEMKKSF